GGGGAVRMCGAGGGVAGTTVTDWNGASTTINGAVSLATLQRNPGENAGNYAITNGTLALTGTLNGANNPAVAGNYTTSFSTTNSQLTAKPHTPTPPPLNKTVNKHHRTNEPQLPALTCPPWLLTGTTAPAWLPPIPTRRSSDLLATLQRNPGENAGNYAITNGTLALTGTLNGANNPAVAGNYTTSFSTTNSQL